MSLNFDFATNINVGMSPTRDPGDIILNNQKEPTLHVFLLSREQAMSSFMRGRKGCLIMADLVGLLSSFGVVLAGLVLVVLLTLTGNFLLWQWFFRKGVLVEGRVGHYTGTETETIGRSPGTTVTVYALEYTYAWNDRSYLKVHKVSSGTYNRMKDGDRVKVWLIPEHPTWVRIEENSPFLTLMRKYGGNMVPKNE
jgi:hypothetical protein